MDQWDIEELAYHTADYTDEEITAAIDDGDINQFISDKYGCEFDTYCAIVEDLIYFTPVVQSPLSGECFHAFVDNKQQVAIVKTEIIKSQKG